MAARPRSVRVRRTLASPLDSLISNPKPPDPSPCSTPSIPKRSVRAILIAVAQLMLPLTALRVMHEITEEFIQAAESGDAAAVEPTQSRPLISAPDASSRSTALFEAASSGHVALVGWLLSHGADPNIPENNGITPLMDAASGGDIAVMRVLLEHGARADLRDNFGDTALVYAQNQKQHAAVELLSSS